MQFGRARTRAGKPSRHDGVVRRAEAPARLRLRHSNLLSLIATALVWSSPVLAQDKVAQSPTGEPPSPAAQVPSLPPQAPSDNAVPGKAPDRIPTPASPASATGAPFSLGSFLIYPELATSWMYDSNVYFSPNDTRLSDRAWIFSPAIRAESNWAKHELDFHASLDSTRYSTYTSENSNDFHLSTEGRYDFSANTNVYGGVHFSQEHEDRESPSARNGLTPTQYHQLRLYGGVFHQFGRVSVRVAGTAQQLTYNNVNFLTSSGAVNIINNSDRDRWQYTGGVRVGYEVTPRIEPYVQIAFDNRYYNSSVDDLGYERDSTGMRYLAGVRWNIPRVLKLDAFAGWLRQDYRDPRFVDVTAPVVGAALQWVPTDRTTVSAYLDRTVEETTVTSTPSPSVLLVSSSYLNTYASLGVEQRLTDKLTVRGTGSLSHVAYKGIPRSDDYYGATVGMSYRFHRNLLLDLSVTARRLNSSVPTENFNQYTVMARVVIPFSH